MNARLTLNRIAGRRLLPRCFAPVAAIALAAVFSAAAAAQTLERIDFSAQRSQVLAQLDHVPEVELRQHHMRCTHVAAVRGLTIGETTVCALVYVALRERAFAGDHRAMAIWTASQRDPELLLLQP